MPIAAHIPQCKHIRTTGIRCGSPAMRGADRCYFHLKPARLEDLQITNINDPKERLRLISAVCNALVRNKIDPKRANAILFALQVNSP